jgi:hypothetical protein
MDESCRFTGARTETASPSAAEGASNDESGPAAVRQFAADFARLRQQAARLVASQFDLAQLKLRRLVLLTVLGTLALLAGATWVITCVVITLVGVAGGLGELFAGRQWLGFLVTGLGLSVLTSLVIYFMVRALSERSRRRIIDKYARSTPDVEPSARAGRSPLGE